MSHAFPRFVLPHQALNDERIAGSQNYKIGGRPSSGCVCLLLLHLLLLLLQESLAKPAGDRLPDGANSEANLGWRVMWRVMRPRNVGGFAVVAEPERRVAGVGVHIAEQLFKDGKIAMRAASMVGGRLEMTSETASKSQAKLQAAPAASNRLWPDNWRACIRPAFSQG
jgi:hypothetical protein